MTSGTKTPLSDFLQPALWHQVLPSPPVIENTKQHSVSFAVSDLCEAVNRGLNVLFSQRGSKHNGSSLMFQDYEILNFLPLGSRASIVLGLVGLGSSFSWR